MKSQTQIFAEMQVRNKRYWESEARRLQSLGQSYRLLGDIAEARRCARGMRACLEILKTLKNK